MKYNWQQSDWGKFTFLIEKIEDALYVFTEKAGQLNGLLKAMPKVSKEDAVIEMLVSEAIKTSEIENEYLSRKDVTSSVRNNLGLYEPNEEVRDIRAKGVGKLMTEIRKTYDQPLTEDILKEWHSFLFLKRTNITVGEYRFHEEPMQVVSGSIGKEKIHFQAPESSEVPNNMKVFIQWFNDTAPNGRNPIKHAPIRSGIAHLYFESIHPFEDGNGRIGRAIADKALSQSFGYPLLLSLSVTVESDKKAYYEALESAQKQNEITAWLVYFLQVIIDSQINAENLINFTLSKARFFDLYRSKLNERQIKTIKKMFKEGVKGFEGGMTTKKHIKITKTSKATATRDLQKLEEIGAFVVKGSGRSTNYELNLDF